MTVETEQFSATQREAGAGSPGSTAAFPYDRMTVERFRAAFPRARWRDDLGAWFVPGTSAERRLNTWSSREWSGVLAHADERGRDAFAFDPVASPYLEVADDLVVRTPYSRVVVFELRMVPWARWNPASKAWRVPFRSFEELRRRWPCIEDAARRAEPEERRKRAASRKASPELLPADALGAVGRVMAFGAGKYGARNWERGMAWLRLWNACLRHLFAWAAGDDRDPETGESHIAHAACCVLFLLAYVQRGAGTDDRAPTLVVEVSREAA